MNILAGILIGVANTGLTAQIISALGWGIVWIIREWILQGHENKRTSFGSQLNVFQYYLVEYLTASVTAMIVAILIGLAKDFFV
jgi:hypothetical protein